MTFARVLALLLALQTATNGNHLKEVETQPRCRCEEIPPGLCATYFQTGDWYGRFPNARGQNLSEAVDEFFDFSHFLTMDNYCSHMLHVLLCFHYFPYCEVSRPELGAIPCREICNEALTSCITHAKALQPNFTFPAHLNCNNFPSSYSINGCGRVDEGAGHCNCITACPGASIHVEFATEPGKSIIYGNESVDICLRLANVGSYDPDARLAEDNIVVQLFPTISSVSRHIVFPVDSEKGTIRCITLDINRDNQTKGVQFFEVFASVISSSGAKIGGDFASTTNSITVKINHCNRSSSSPPSLSSEPEIPCNECRSLLCNWRTDFSRNTFTNNHYSFVAKVQVVEITVSVLEVYMLECYNITRKVCPEETPVCIKLATCPNCQLKGDSVGREFIVAGGHTEGGSLFIANNRKKGLLSSDHSGRWSDFIPLA